MKTNPTVQPSAATNAQEHDLCFCDGLMNSSQVIVVSFIFSMTNLSFKDSKTLFIAMLYGLNWHERSYQLLMLNEFSVSKCRIGRKLV